MAFFSETQKIRDRVWKYVHKGHVLDIGCGHDKVSKESLGVDVRPLDFVNCVTDKLEDLPSVLPDLVGKCDAVYSSHCLEHFKDDWNAMLSWLSMLKRGGYLVLYLPCDTKYDNKANPDHVHSYTRESFLKKFSFLVEIGYLDVVEAFDDYGDDRYSFCVVYRRTKKGFKRNESGAVQE